MTAHVGDWGESLAADHLERAGWTILARNYRIGRNEIDLVARRGEVVAFVEVKTRATTTMGHPFESITEKKQREIAKAIDRSLAPPLPERIAEGVA